MQVKYKYEKKSIIYLQFQLTDFVVQKKIF
jgi:hypothetical protein